MTIILSNDLCSASINTKGAELNSFKNLQTNREYIWNGNPEFWGKHSPVLFPVVGALKDDCYYYEGKKYNLSRHGFARDFEFEVIESSSNAASFLLKQNSEIAAKYPFDFELQMDYKLVDRQLVLSYTIRNKSDVEMPFSIGAHPAFALPNSFTDYSLEFEHEEKLITHELENNLFSGKTRPINLDKTNLPLTYSLFEKDALVLKTIQSKKVTILENKKPLLKVNFDDFSSLGIWTVQNAPFICIEPWIGFADDATSDGNLFEKTNIQILQPSTSFGASFSIEIL
ncbi:aldose 1-epimerase family protein [Flavobacterium aquatile]|uniref:Aldose epimerase n=1 Tax=Flavobacterium aquatile LMG 4008 = ATCC 11947 TaxID=1453498 RepID=A0A095STM6_9FLAO|nr:aldose 1-epimerase family protein [Flavobacterium aquatile]KGD67689.1 aldose epimerase [Flavobacterium aquatile LMG 4008 = ATCC 11947]OXA67554.1 aldose epimerase [Flavobacterium aquatile] [Flavobacterium aquatile LMG 4008 = ATCC 11947]GEC78184.1 LACX protein [Flavobacterium aquatile]